LEYSGNYLTVISVGFSHKFYVYSHDKTIKKLAEINKELINDSRELIKRIEERDEELLKLIKPTKKESRIRKLINNIKNRSHERS